MQFPRYRILVSVNLPRQTIPDTGIEIVVFVRIALVLRDIELFYLMVKCSRVTKAIKGWTKVPLSYQSCSSGP